MGCQIYAEGEGKNLPEVCYTRGAWLVAHICNPWYDFRRDGSCIGPGAYQIDRVDLTSMQQAIATVPEHFSEWLKKNEPFAWVCRDTTQDDYETALRFIDDCVKLGCGASLSY